MFVNKRGGLEIWPTVVILILTVSILVGIPVIKYGFMSSGRAKLSGLGSDHKVEMYSGGKLVREWVSDGKVINESNSDGYFFEDKETGKLIEVSGDVVITRLN